MISVCQCLKNMLAMHKENNDQYVVREKARRLKYSASYKRLNDKTDSTKDIDYIDTFFKD